MTVHPFVEPMYESKPSISITSYHSKNSPGKACILILHLFSRTCGADGALKQEHRGPPGRPGSRERGAATTPPMPSASYLTTLGSSSMMAGCPIGRTHVPPCSVQHPSLARADLPGGAISPQLGERAQGAASGDEGRRRPGAPTGACSYPSSSARTSSPVTWTSWQRDPPPIRHRIDAQGSVAGSSRPQRTACSTASCSDKTTSWRFWTS